MTLKSIGSISEINRYPVKSLAGESVDTIKIEPYGLYGDRCHAFIDETKEGWDSFFTARDIPSMLSYKAELIGESADEEFLNVNVTSPDGTIFNWDDDLLVEMQKYTKKKMSMLSYKTQQSDLMAVDMGSILIITDAELRKLEALWGKSLDKRRFRANLVVTLDESICNESDLIGKRLLVGSTELQVDIYCDRCSMITIHPDTLERDASLLKKVNEEMDLNFGVYASVKKTGQLNVGEKVYLVE
ncbi:MAG TPA: MOSC N-terminal beta barrel domain-containing protein [Candidatus Udaeobacter sp.]|nr:MOSC N-terminal beta barrel domain-containing protein [Candidatus Udaeobacter sp.]